MMRRLVIDDVSAILLDFDGPVCSVFSGYPAALVADELRAALVRLGITGIEDVRSILDPLAILRWAGEKYPELAEDVDAVLTAAERKAVRSAQPTADAHRVMIAAGCSGRSIAIVSNNSAEAINDYLSGHELSANVSTVAARPFGKPTLMKPNPALVLEATRKLGVSPDRTIFVGDSATDVEAGHAAGIRVVGYAKTSRHGQILASAKPEFLIGSMGELADALDNCA